jgi:hypothetical protein
MNFNFLCWDAGVVKNPQEVPILKAGAVPLCHGGLFINYKLINRF